MMLCEDLVYFDIVFFVLCDGGWVVGMGVVKCLLVYYVEVKFMYVLFEECGCGLFVCLLEGLIVYVC